MGIVNAGKLPLYEDVERNLRTILSEVILNESEKNDHVDRLIAYAENVKNELEEAK